jgi:thiamine pyrophosphokinase
MADPARVLVVADGDVDLRLLAELAGAADRPTIIAADGGAGRALGAGVTPDLVVGDFDSLSEADHEQLRSLGVDLREAARDKDESDLELCLLTALQRGARDVTVLGALGSTRPEHGLANLLLLADPRLDDVRVTIAGHGSRITRTGTAVGPGRVSLEGTPGDFVSLLPLDAAVEGVTTTGLRFSLAGETLSLGPTRGLSNELLDRQAGVTSLRGRLLVVHTSRAALDAQSAGGS